jgi:hypothetical protein
MITTCLHDHGYGIPVLSTPSRRFVGGAVVLSAAAAVGVRNLRQRQAVPDHTETHLSVSCADGRYAQARAAEALRLRPHWWGPEPRTVFPQTPPGGGAAVLHPTFGPALLDAVELLRSVHHFDMVELRLHVGGPGGCGYLNTMASGSEPMWSGSAGRPGSRSTSWSEFDVAAPPDVLRIGEVARDVVADRFADDPLEVRVRVDEFRHNLAGLPNVRTILTS